MGWETWIGESVVEVGYMPQPPGESGIPTENTLDVGGHEGSLHQGSRITIAVTGMTLEKRERVI